jgi:hypothetical protein
MCIILVCETLNVLVCPHKKSSFVDVMTQVNQIQNFSYFFSKIPPNFFTSSTSSFSLLAFSLQVLRSENLTRV